MYFDIYYGVVFGTDMVRCIFLKNPIYFNTRYDMLLPYRPRYCTVIHNNQGIAARFSSRWKRFYPTCFVGTPKPVVLSRFYRGKNARKGVNGECDYKRLGNWWNGKGFKSRTRLANETLLPVMRTGLMRNYYSPSLVKRRVHCVAGSWIYVFAVSSQRSDILTGRICLNLNYLNREVSIFWFWLYINASAYSFCNVCQTIKSIKKLSFDYINTGLAIQKRELGFKYCTLIS